MNIFKKALIVALSIGLISVPSVTREVEAASQPSTLYLTPNNNWKNDNPWYAAYYFGSTGNKWSSMTDSDSDGIYEVSVPSGYDNVIFCRMNPGNKTTLDWSNKWNQTADLTIPTDGTNHYTVKDNTWDKGGGTWSTYTPGGQVTPEPEPEPDPTPTEVHYSIVGDFNGWNVSDTTYTMTPNAEKTVYTYSDFLVTSITSFKVAKDYSWDVSYGNNGQNYAINEPGYYDITFNVTTEKITVTKTADYIVEGDPYENYIVTFAGDYNGWNTSATEFEYLGDGVFQLNDIEIAAGKLEYKILVNGSWDPMSSNNRKFPEAGTYTITVTFESASNYSVEMSKKQIVEEETAQVTNTNVRVYFNNETNWETPYFYSWDASGNKLSNEWPGTPMTRIGETNYYYYDTVAGANAIFNNNSGDQTRDLVVPADGNNVYSHKNGASANWYSISGLEAYYQEKDSATAGYSDVRLLSTFEGLKAQTLKDYDNVGFVVGITYNGETQYTEVTTTRVYTSVEANGETVTPSDLESNSTYLFAIVINNVPSGAKIFVTPFAQSEVNFEIGISKTFEVNRV